MIRYYLPYGDDFSMGIKTPVSCGIKHGDYTFTCGQSDIGPNGIVLDGGDIFAQTKASMEYIEKILSRLKTNMRDIAKINVNYVNDGSFCEEAYRKFIYTLLPKGHRPVLIFTPLKRMWYGVLVELDIFGVSNQSHQEKYYTYNEKIAYEMVKTDELIFWQFFVKENMAAQRQAQVLFENIGEILSENNLKNQDILFMNTQYHSQEVAKCYEYIVEERERFFDGIVPPVRDIPVEDFHSGLPFDEIRIEMITTTGKTGVRRVTSTEGVCDWLLPGRSRMDYARMVNNMVFFGSHEPFNSKTDLVAVNDVAAQTHYCMQNISRVLQHLNADFQDMLKMTVYYVGSDSADDLHKHLSIRCTYIGDPGAGSTGNPITEFPIKGMLIQCDGIAIIREPNTKFEIVKW